MCLMYLLCSVLSFWLVLIYCACCVYLFVVFVLGQRVEPRLGPPVESCVSSYLVVAFVFSSIVGVV